MRKAEKTATYEQSMQELELIAVQLERGEMPIDKMADELRRAQALLGQCRQRLLAVDDEVQKIVESMSV